MIKILFIGGLGSTGGKATKIADYLEGNGVEYKLDKITPDYINDNPVAILVQIQNLLDNAYDYIFASSTGCLFALNAIGNSPIRNKISINLINPLLHLGEEKKNIKDKQFLTNMLPLMNKLKDYDFDKTNLQFNFFLSNNDEVIGVQEPAIQDLNFPQNTNIYIFADGHRMSKSMTRITVLSRISID